MAVQMKGGIVKGKMVEVNSSEILEAGKDEWRDGADWEAKSLIG